MPKEKFAKLLDDVQKTLEECPWCKEQTLDSLKEEPSKEAKELKEAIEKKDFKNIKEEIGDLIYDTVLIALVAEKQGILTLKDVIHDVNEKIRRRKPWCFGGDKVNDSAEALQRWHEIKRKEKEKKN